MWDLTFSLSLSLSPHHENQTQSPQKHSKREGYRKTHRLRVHTSLTENSDSVPCIYVGWQLVTPASEDPSHVLASEGNCTHGLTEIYIIKKKNLKINKSSRPRLKYQLTVHSQNSRNWRCSSSVFWHCRLTINAQFYTHQKRLFKQSVMSYACTPALVRLRQEEGKFQASLGYMARLSQKTQKATWM